MQGNRTLTAAVRQAVEDALSARFGARIHIASDVHNFWPSYVYRCPLLQSSSAAVPETVIVRVPREGIALSERTGLNNEQTALNYLTEIDNSLAPRLLACDASAGFLAMEDIGAYPSLLDLLLGQDAEAARQGTRAFARGPGDCLSLLSSGDPSVVNCTVSHGSVRFFDFE